MSNNITIVNGFILVFRLSVYLCWYAPVGFDNTINHLKYITCVYIVEKLYLLLNTVKDFYKKNYFWDTWYTTTLL